MGDTASSRSGFVMSPSWLPSDTKVGAMESSSRNHQDKFEMSSGEMPCVFECTMSPTTKMASGLSARILAKASSKEARYSWWRERPRQ